MLAKEIEKVREELNTMLNLEESPYNEILNLSQELDILIVRYLRENYI